MAVMFLDCNSFLKLMMALLITFPTGFAIAQECLHGQYRCQDGSCIKSYLVCDGIADCNDKSDELHAVCLLYNVTTCLPGMFRCAYGGCIGKSKVCDGTMDCIDNSDELLMSCPEFQWLNGSYPKCRSVESQCRNGQCISLFDFCDGVPNCSDKSDESISRCHSDSSSTSLCPAQTFQCAYGANACVSINAKCDFKIDCADGSDEHYILCNRPPPINTLALPENVLLQCTLPNYEGTFYSRLNTDSEHLWLKPGDKVDDKSFVFFRCANTHELVSDIDTLVCLNRTWPGSGDISPCRRKVTCPRLSSHSLQMNCKYNGQPVACDEPNRPKTVAEITCKEGYSTGQSLKNMICLSSGEWENINQSCNFSCGILNSQNRIMKSVSGVQVSNHPWNVGIYLRVKGNKITRFCSGTLISPYSVLTAGHCMINSKLMDKNDYNDISKFKRQKNRLNVAFGKYQMDWDSEENIEKRNVAEVYIPKNYMDFQNNYFQNIAILELTSPVKLSDSVIPVCLDENRLHGLEQNMMGSVVGWELQTAANTPESNNVLKMARLPYVHHEICQETYLNCFLAPDKYCAFSADGITAAVGRFDGGAGFIFEFNNVHYIYGVAATLVNGTCVKNTNNSVNVFTNITDDEILRFVIDTQNHIANKFQ